MAEFLCHLEELADVLASGHKLRLVTKPERDHAMAGKVGGVQSKTDGYGFTLSAERGGTGLMLSYETREAAIEARKKMAEAFARRDKGSCGDANAAHSDYPLDRHGDLVRRVGTLRAYHPPRSHRSTTTLGRVLKSKSVPVNRAPAASAKVDAPRKADHRCVAAGRRMCAIG